MKKDTATASEELSSVAEPTAPSGPHEPQGIGIGDIVGRYTVRSHLGAGAMGEVFAAHDPDLNRLVALKLLRGSASGTSPAARIRFQREAQALARLSHPNVVSVFDVGTVRGQVFVAMELVEGPTLAVWLAEAPRTVAEVVDVFLQAGRGLEVAHAAGIVHRDFKPANVILGARVRVVDFGLARVAGEAPDDLDGTITPTSLEMNVTQTGQWVGTPAYLAPEVRRGKPSTAASDQYAFGVALHEALTGVRPGEAAARSLPRPLRRVVRRALEVDPARRYPSMTALLADLGRDRRARFAAVAAGGVVVAVGALFAFRPSAPPPCAGGPAQVASVWSADARARAEAAFRKTGQFDADDTFVRVDAALRHRLDGWAVAYRDTCEATEVRHEQSGELLDRRMACLGSARKDIGAFVDLLGQVDVRAMRRAVLAAGEVGDTVDCATVSPVPPRRSPDVQKVEEELARLRGMQALGQVKPALAFADEVVAHARAAGFAPALVQSLLVRGYLRANSGGGPAMLDDLDEAMRLGAEIKDDANVARAASLIAGSSETRKGGAYATADVAYRFALASNVRAGNRPDLLWSLYHNRANVLYEKGDYVATLALYQLQLLVAPTAFGPDSWRVAVSLQDLADAMSALGAGPAILPLYPRALAILEKALGPTHERVATLLINQALALLNVRDADGAADALERAATIDRGIYGDASYQVGNVLSNLALARLGQGRVPEARAAIDEATALTDAALGPGSRWSATDFSISAEVARAEGKLAEAHELKRRSLEAYVKISGAGTLNEAIGQREDAVILLALGRVADARVAAERAVTVETAQLGEHHPDLGMPLGTLADVQAAEGRFAEAIATYRKAIALLENYGEDWPFLVEPLDGLAAALAKTGYPAAAATASERALRIARAKKLAPSVIASLHRR